jgi:hypothetical protein
MRTKVCFIGGARYSQPLDATSEKKWHLLSELGEMFVIGFSQDLRPRRFTQHTPFLFASQVSAACLALPCHVYRWSSPYHLVIMQHDVRVLPA